MTWARSRHATFLAFGCVHAPVDDAESVAWAVALAHDHQPDYLVCCGDLLEASAASRWPNEDQWTLLDEYHRADEILTAFMDASPKSKLVFMEGNHDHNIRAENRIPKSLRSLCDYRRFIPSLSAWQFVEYRNHPDSVFRVGQVTFAHGFASSRSARHREAYRLGVPNGLTVLAHDHRPKAPERCMGGATFPLDRYVAGTGCLRDLNPEYMRRDDNTEHGHGVILGHARTGRAVQAKRNWHAELHVCKMAHGDAAPGAVVAA